VGDLFYLWDERMVMMQPAGCDIGSDSVSCLLTTKENGFDWTFSEE